MIEQMATKTGDRSGDMLFSPQISTGGEEGIDFPREVLVVCDGAVLYLPLGGVWNKSNL